jgi:hypothetical protein
MNVEFEADFPYPGSQDYGKHSTLLLRCLDGAQPAAIKGSLKEPLGRARVGVG